MSPIMGWVMIAIGLALAVAARPLARFNLTFGQLPTRWAVDPDSDLGRRRVELLTWTARATGVIVAVMGVLVVTGAVGWDA